MRRVLSILVFFGFAVVSVFMAMPGRAEAANCLIDENACQKKVTDFCDCGTVQANPTDDASDFCLAKTNKVFSSQGTCRTDAGGGNVPGSCSAAESGCENGVVATCLCGSAVAIQGQFCWAGGNQVFDQQNACNGAKGGGASACPAGQNLCQSAVTAACDCGGAPAAVAKWCWSLAAIPGDAVSDSWAACETKHGCANKSCEGAATKVCICGTSAGSAKIADPTGEKYCWAAGNLVFNDKSSCEAAKGGGGGPVDCRADENACQKGVIAECICGTATAAESKFCLAKTGQLFDSQEQCRTTTGAAAPCDSLDCESGVGGNCLCGSAVAMASQFCWAGGNKVFNDSNACEAAKTGAGAAPGELLPSGLSPCQISHDIRGCNTVLQNPETKTECPANGDYETAGCTDCSEWTDPDPRDEKEDYWCQVEACCLLDKIYTIADWIFVVLLVVAGIFVLWGGIEFITASGAPEKLGSARNKLIWALVGVVVAFISRGAVNLITQIIK